MDEIFDQKCFDSCSDWIIIQNTAIIEMDRSPYVSVYQSHHESLSYKYKLPRIATQRLLYNSRVR